MGADEELIRIIFVDTVATAVYGRTKTVLMAC